MRKRIAWMIGLGLVCVMPMARAGLERAPQAAKQGLITGQVIAVASGNKTAYFVPDQEINGGQEKVELSLNELKNLWGIESLDKLKPGSHVALQVHNSEKDVWTVETLQVMAETNPAGEKEIIVRDINQVTTKPETVVVEEEKTMAHDEGNPKYQNLAREKSDEVVKIIPPVTATQESVTVYTPDREKSRTPGNNQSQTA